MAKNQILRAKVAADIDDRVERVLRGLGNPEPPIDLRLVRDLLKLDRAYYSLDDPGLLQETVSKLRVAGKQVLLRPTLLIEAARKLELRALYIPDQKRILIDQSQPELKHRWTEAHEIGHSLIPWHEGAMLGDNDQTLMPACHAKLESEANDAAARILFLRDRFTSEALDLEPSMNSLKALAETFGNTFTSTFWRCVETWGRKTPLVGLVTGHPHPYHRNDDFDPTNPCRYFIQSPAFAIGFSEVGEVDLFHQIAQYCTSKRGGPLGTDEIIITDDNSEDHIFVFESFSFWHYTLTLGLYLHPRPTFAITNPN